METTRRNFLAMSYGLGMGLNFSLADEANAQMPDFEASFDEARSGYQPVADYSFGSSSPPAGSVGIADTATLAQHFNHWAANLANDTATINIENQRYMPFSSAPNFVFESDSLELTATLPDGLPPNVGQTTASAAVARSRTLTLSDASSVFVGQVLSFGDRQLENQHVTRSHGIRGPIAAGDTVTLTVSLSAIGRPDVALSQTAQAVSTNMSLAQGFVDLVNGDSALQSLGIGAFKGAAPGAYHITYPRYDKDDAPFGPTALGSLQWMGTSVSKTGAIVHEVKGSNILIWVTSKNGNQVTLNHPLTIPAGHPVFLLPSKMTERSDDYNGGSAIVPLADTEGLALGQAVTFGSNDSNYRFITAKTAGSITVNASVHVTDGVLVTSQPIWMAPLSAAVANSAVLSFAAVPAGVRVGMQMIQYSNNPNNNIRVVSIDRTSTPQTVTVDAPISRAINAVMLFHDAIRSAQVWTKTGYTPGEAGRDWIALELECDVPDAADIAAWPAFWLFRNPNDPTGIDVPANSASEIDMTDLFNYWSNLSSNCHRPQNGTPSSEIGRNADYHNGQYVVGNNMGLKTRRIQAIWGLERVYYYIDGLFVLARTFTYNRSARAQIGINLAVGTTSTSFTSNGFFPLDATRFPMKYRIKRFRIWGAADN